MEAAPTGMSFEKKLGLTALFVIVVLLVKATFNVFLMALAACLIALYFLGLAALVRRKIKISHRASMAISIGGSFILLLLLFWLIGSKVQSQVGQLSEKFPTLVEQAKVQLNQTAIGQKILQQSSGNSGKKLMTSAKKLFNSTFGVLGDIYVILFLGIFLTASPSVYKEGVIALIPPHGKEKGRQVMMKLGHNLRSWLKGKLFSMAVVAILTGIGLSIMGMPMVFALAVIAGILNFIPNFGPVIAMIPAVLLAFTQGSNTALMVAALYIFIQVLESNFITPTVQRRLVSIPPAMIIISQLLVGSLTGYLGIILATPIVLIVMVLVKELYINWPIEK